MEPHNSKAREGERNANPAHRISGSNYNYNYYPQNSDAYPPRQQQWSDWTVEQHHYNNANSVPRQNFNEMANTNNPLPPYVPPRSTYFPYTATQNNSRPFHPQRRYNSNHQYSPNQPNWNRNLNYKRTRLNSEDHTEPRSKHLKKKKKPLSQNVPSKKDWTFHEAEQALNCEKEYNKRNKNQSLIIKFPDLELNKDIVSKFHSSIENVHFQQPSTARFCFVTLGESADGNSVISALNKIKFGEGYLTAEYKKDREDDQNIGPNDIDPLTLYVGNLAQEITKEDMVKAYPKCRRIDIGYAKRMKYTRYAFVTFKTVIDSIEAFKKTHSTQMYSKSLIVRFRRLHGTVGMPGESKAQNQPKSSKDDNLTEESDTVVVGESVKETEVNGDEEQVEDKKGKSAVGVNLNLVKMEPPESSGEEDEDDENICDITEHRPIKLEVKSEPPLNDNNEEVPIVDLLDVKKKVKGEIKEEFDDDEEEEEEEPQFNEVTNQSSDDDDDDGNDDDFDTEINFSEMYSSMVAQANNISSLSKMNP